MLNVMLALLIDAPRVSAEASTRAVQLCSAEIARRGGSTTNAKWVITTANGRLILRTGYAVKTTDGTKNMNVRCLTEGDRLLEAIAVEAICRRRLNFDPGMEVLSR